MTLECKRFESNGELLDNGEMFLYRQGNIVSVLGLVPLKSANRYTPIKLMGQVVPFNYSQQNLQVNS